MRSFLSPSAKHPLPSSTSAGVLRRATADGARATEVSRDDATSLSAAVDTGLRSPAQALDAPTRALMEARFDWDFSKVRIHADAAAAESARALQARAYTVGNDIMFGKGEFSPTSHSGKSLLAHELAHTVQQRGTSRAVNEL